MLSLVSWMSLGFVNSLHFIVYSDRCHAYGRQCLLNPEHLDVCYWLDQFLTLANNAWVLSKFSMFYWICLLSVLLVSMDVDRLLCQAVALS